LHGLIALCLCAPCATVLAVPKAAEHEDDAVTFADAEAPPKRITKAASLPPAAKPSPSVAKDEPTGKPGKAAARTNPSDEKHANKVRPAAENRRQRASHETRVVAPKKTGALQKTVSRKK
jgi:hypothetical protein